jgi:hypothetical protein
VLHQDSVFQADNIRRYPVDRLAEAREAAMDDYEVYLRYDYSPLILEGGWNALDQVEKTVTARLNVRTVLGDLLLARREIFTAVRARSQPKKVNSKTQVAKVPVISMQDESLYADRSPSSGSPAFVRGHITKHDPTP